MASHSLPEDRTNDVTLDKSYTFENMLLPEPILKALTEAGYIYPSMIQKKGIPIGRCGYSEFISATYTTTQITLPPFQTSSSNPNRAPAKPSSSA